MKRERERTMAGLIDDPHCFETTFYQAAVGIAHVALDGRFVRINPAFCDIIGYSSEEIIGNTFQQITHPDDLQSDLEHVNALLKGESVDYTMEKRYITKQQTIVWVDLTVHLVRDEANNPHYFIAVVKNISERKYLEVKLFETEQTMSTYINLANMIFLVLDREGNVTFINQKGIEFLCSSSDKIIGKSWFETFLFEEDKEEMMSVFTCLLAGECDRYSYHENRITTADGETRLIAWHNTVLKDSSGAVIGTLSAGEDITQKRKDEITISENNRTLRAILDAIPLRIFFKDETSNYITCNANYAKDRGITPEEITGADDYRFYPKELADKYRFDDSEVLAKNEIREMDEAYEVEGKTRWVHTIKVPMKKLGDGDAKMILGIFWDETEKIERSQKLTRQLEQLEKFHALTIGRELRMKELKEENERLKQALKTYEERK